MFTIGSRYITKNYDTSKVLYDYDFIILHNIGASLLLLGENDQYYSNIASKWEVVDKKITFTIDTNAKFSDGSKITSQDIYNTFQRILVKGATHLDLKSILESMTILGSDRIEFNFKSMNSQILYLFTLPDGAILSNKQLDKDLNIVSWNISSGPYFIKSSNDNEVVLEKNEYSLLAKKDSLKNIKLIELTSDTEIANKLIKKEINHTFTKTLSDSDAIKTIFNSNTISKTKHKITGVTYLFLNIQHKLFKDVKHRQAFVKKFLKNKPDLRPIKNDDIFINANQFFLPNTTAILDDKIVKERIAKFNANVEIPIQEKLAMYVDHCFGKEEEHQLLSALNKLNLNVYIGEKVTMEDRKKINSKAPIRANLMYLNEKELSQSLIYIYNMGLLFDSKKNEIKKITDEIYHSKDAAEKSRLLRKINELIIEDAVIIPLYYRINYDFITNDYEIINKNSYISTPRLWDIRKVDAQIK